MEPETPHGIHQQSHSSPLFRLVGYRPIDYLNHFAVEKPAWKLAALLVMKLPAMLWSAALLLHAMVRGGWLL